MLCVNDIEKQPAIILLFSVQENSTNYHVTCEYISTHIYLITVTVAHSTK